MSSYQVKHNKIKVDFAVIGGSGFYTFPELQQKKLLKFKTPFGFPSAPLMIGFLGPYRVAFLPRHGLNHEFPPHHLPYRANLWALKSLQPAFVIAFCTVGSLQRNIKPGDLVILDQFIDLTWGRDDTFKEDNNFTHLLMDNVYDSEIGKLCFITARKLGFKIHRQGTVVVIQGPRFNTFAESLWFHHQKWSVVNMTQYPECYFAKEMELRYAALATVTDYDLPSLNSSTALNHLFNSEQGFKIFEQNVMKSRLLIQGLTKNKLLTSLIVKEKNKQTTKAKEMLYFRSEYKKNVSSN